MENRKKRKRKKGKKKRKKSGFYKDEKTNTFLTGANIEGQQKPPEPEEEEPESEEDQHEKDLRKKQEKALEELINEPQQIWEIIGNQENELTKNINIIEELFDIKRIKK